MCLGVPGKLTPKLASREMSSANCKAQELCWECKSALYWMVHEIKWEKLFHLNQQITAKSLPGLIHAHREHVWLAVWPTALAQRFAALPTQVLGARHKVLGWAVSRQLPGEPGELPAAPSPLHSLTPMTSLQMCKWHRRGLCAELVIRPHPVYPPLVCRNMLDVRNVSLA